MPKEIFWVCPVDGFKAKNKNEQDKHMQETGHLIFNDTEDKGTETPEEPDDLSYSEHSGYTPGISSGDVVDESPDIESRNRAFEKSKKKKSK
jgi:hypothetical protein